MNQPRSSPWRRMLAEPFAAVMQAVLPSACALCGMRCAAALCQPCHAQYLDRWRPRCPVCANPVGAADVAWPCGACQIRRPAFDATVAAADYASPLDQLVLHLKFGGELALAPCFGRALAAALEAAQARGARIALPDLLCPVPLGRARLAERGFNQAFEMARPLARALGITLHPALLVRALETAAQSGVELARRRHNVRRAFTLTPASSALVRGRHVGVVDDVMTSGATLDEVAATLKRFGAARVTNLVFARTPPHV